MINKPKESSIHTESPVIELEAQTKKKKSRVLYTPLDNGSESDLNTTRDQYGDEPYLIKEKLVS